MKFFNLNIKSRNASKFLVIFTLLLIGLFSFGCIKKAEPLDKYLSSEQINSIQVDYKSYNNCTVMVCEYDSFTSKIWDWVKSLFSTTQLPSLDGKSCKFISYDLDKNEQKQELESLLGKSRYSQASSSKFVQPFMIGIGDSVFAGDEMYGRCQGMLGINEIDLNIISNSFNDQNKELLQSLTKCDLQQGTIPLYKFQKWNSGFISQFSNSLNGKGIVLVAPGFEYDSQHFTQQILNPSGSFYAIKSACPNCLTVAVVKYGDFNTLNFYKNYRLDWDNIDVIGFTVDLNNFSSCTSKQIIFGNDSIKSFAQNLTETYGKPILVLDIYGKEGRNYLGTCNWKNDSLAMFYDEIIRYNQELVSSGVIGLTIKDISSLPQEALNATSISCSVYYSRSPNSYSSFIIYSKKGDVTSSCSLYNQNSAILLINQVDYSKTQTPTYREDRCYLNLCLDSSIRSAGSAGTFEKQNCDKDYLFINNIAAKKFIDPSLLMAGLDQSGYYSGQINYQGNCECKEYNLDSNEYHVCCVAESLANYTNIAKSKNIKNAKWIAYIGLYGLKYGSSNINNEISKIKGSSDVNMQSVSDSDIDLKQEKTVSFDSQENKISSKQNSLYLQFSLCDIYLKQCTEWGDINACRLYEYNCGQQHPTQPPTETPGQPSPPQPPSTPQPPDVLPIPETGEQIYQGDPSVMLTVMEINKIRDICGICK